MAMKVRVVCRPDRAVGFGLAGLAVERARDPGAAADAVRRLAADPDVGIIVIDDHLHRSLPHELTTRLDRQAVPIVAPCPGPVWDARGEAEAYVLEILRQAIGYRVRPR
jgi:vacuolar-type H+-ATPase subunit F/Vma7